MRESLKLTDNLYCLNNNKKFLNISGHYCLYKAQVKAGTGIEGKNRTISVEKKTRPATLNFKATYDCEEVRCDYYQTKSTDIYS